MKVLHVTAAAERGGVETVLINTLRCTDRSRFTPEVLLLHDGPFVRDVEETGTIAHVMESGRIRELLKARRTVVKARELIRSRQISVVHSHNPLAHVYAGLAAVRENVPALLHLHGVPRFTLTPEGMISFLSVTIPAQRTVACSAYVAQAFGRAWNSHRELSVVHNGVVEKPLATDSSSLRHEFDIPESSSIVVTACRLQRWKGVHVFLDAAAVVASSYPKICFVIVGSPLRGLKNEYLTELHKKVETLKLSEVVRFVGFQPDVFRFYSAADLVVHSSVEPEPFGMVLVEAMSCGKPVIASKSGGPLEIVVDGVTGLLVPPGQASHLADAILSLLFDPHRRTIMGQAGAARVKTLFRAEHMVMRLQEIYEQMVNARVDT